MLTSSKFRGSDRLQAAALNRPVLRTPERSDAVRLLQEALASLGYSFPQSSMGGRFDGIYGDETTQRGAQFQRAHGLMVDGTAGKQTLEKLDAMLRGAPGAGQPVAPATGPGGVMEPAGAGAGQKPQGGVAAPGNGTRGGQGAVNPGEYLLVGMALFCPHRATVSGTAIPGTPFISGSRSGGVQSYPNMGDGPYSFSNCAVVRWAALDWQNAINGHLLMRRAGAGICCSMRNEPVSPVIVASG